MQVHQSCVCEIKFILYSKKYLPASKQGDAAISAALLSSVYIFCQVRAQKQNIVSYCCHLVDRRGDTATEDSISQLQEFTGYPGKIIDLIV